MKKSQTLNLSFKVMILTLMMTLSSCGIQSIPKANNAVEAAWAEVVNQFQRRADLIPNLVKVVKQYAKHEKDTLEAVVNARAKATQTVVNAEGLTPQTMQSFSQAQNGLTSALSRLMVVVEKYPDLKANQNFRDLQVQLEGTENRITVARQRYIEKVRIFNDLVTVIPTSWTNSIFLKFDKKPQYTVENAKEIEKAPEVNF